MADNITQQELVKIFSNRRDREIFIGTYTSFLKDDFLPFYERFIDENYLSHQSDILIDVMDLSINIYFFDEKYLLHFWELYRAKRFEYRLTFLDYVFFFRIEIKHGLYIDINRSILNTARNNEIRFQAHKSMY